MKILMILTAVIEGAIGIGLFVLPNLLVGAILGAPNEGPAGVVLSRLAGAGLIALAVCCWHARDAESSGAGLGVVMAMFFFNLAADAVLVYAGVRLGLQSPYIWPVIVIHSALAFWCGAVIGLSFRRQRADDGVE